MWSRKTIDNPGAAILHGVKYEDVAVNIYENRNRVKIAEYGCIPLQSIILLVLLLMVFVTI